MTEVPPLAFSKEATKETCYTPNFVVFATFVVKTLFASRSPAFDLLFALFLAQSAKNFFRCNGESFNADAHGVENRIANDRRRGIHV